MAGEQQPLVGTRNGGQEDEKDSDYACYCCWPYSLEREISNWERNRTQEMQMDFAEQKVPKRFFGARKAMKWENAGPVCVTFLRWWIPGFVNTVSTFACMVMLHYGTYYYVHQMQLITTVFKRNHFGNETSFHEEWVKQNEDVPLSIGWDWHRPKSVSDLVNNETGIPRGKLSYGSLNDPIELAMGFQQVDIGILDKIAAFFPMGFMLSAFLMDELSVYTKIMICNSLLAFGKGFFGIVTTVPDSKGWGECQNRLGETGLGWMKHAHNFSEFVDMELRGVPDVDTGLNVHLRWCADMMYSGHTYFTTLYALGTYELTYLFTKEFRAPARNLCLAVVALIAITQQCIEIYFVLLNRFHYTMDVAMAILLTFLFYTNGAITQAAKNWQYIKFWKGKKPDRDESSDAAFAFAVKKSAASVSESVETQMKANLMKRMKPQQPGETNAAYNTYKDEYTKRVDETVKHFGVSVVRTKDLKTNADVFVPPCCSCIFCGCIGRGACLTTGLRHHMFETEDMGDFLFAADEETQIEMCQHMRLSKLHDIDNNKYKKQFKLVDELTMQPKQNTMGNVVAPAPATASAPAGNGACC